MSVQARIEQASLTRIAEETGLHVSYISRLLRSKDRDPSLSNAAKVAKSLGITIDDLSRHLESAVVN